MRALAVALVALAILAGCGGGGGGAAQPAGSIKVTMTEYSFNPSTISVPSGKAVFFLVNAGSISHDMIIRDTSGQRVSGAASELVSAGDSFVFTVTNLPAGSYSFFCDQPGHEASGMKGTITAT
ncbi:MAG TPA: cupredoxin domain-containing protein [Methylomirabilota bacterium]|nr:cupredoxin domain-containing protein [Methylomirabilota bacterium]